MANLQLPTLLVIPFRAALQAAGYSPNIITDDGNLDPGQLVATAYDTIEFRSTLLPLSPIRTAEFVDGKPSGLGFGALLKPAIILTGRNGKVEIAPYGTPDASTAWFGLALIVGGLFGVGYLVGRSGRH